MSEINKNTFKSVLIALLISIFFAIPFLFIHFNLIQLGDVNLVIINMYIIIQIVYNIFSCVLIDLSDKEDKLKLKIKTVIQNIIITTVILIVVLLLKGLIL